MSATKAQPTKSAQLMALEAGGSMTRETREILGADSTKEWGEDQVHCPV